MKTELPSGDSKYDPLRDLLSSEAHPSSEGRLDMLRGLLKIELPSGDSRYDPLPALLSSEAEAGQTPREKLGVLKALLKAELPLGDSRYDPLPEILAAEPQQKQNALQSLFGFKVPAANSKFDPLKEILGNLRGKAYSGGEAGHSQADPFLAHSAEPSDRDAGSQGFQSEAASPSGNDQLSSGRGLAAANSLRGTKHTEGVEELGNALSSANQRETLQPGAFDPSFVRALKGQFSEAQSPDTGFPLDARDPRLGPEQKASIISMQPPSERPFAAGSGPSWLEEASTSLASPECGSAVANPDAAVAKMDAAVEKTDKLQRDGLRVMLAPETWCEGV